jgi:hypothetical protein
MSSSDATLAAQIALIAGTVAVAIGLFAYSEPHSDDLFGRAKNALDDATSPHNTILDRLTSFADSASDSLKPWTTISPTSAATPSATLFDKAPTSTPFTPFTRAPEGFVGENDDDLKAWMAMAN